MRRFLVVAALAVPGTLIARSAPPPRWSSQASGGSALNGIAAVSSSVAWTVGDAGLIRSTSDGGTTWTAVTSPTTSSLRAVHPAGWIAGDNGTILTTPDGGATWISRTCGDLRGLACSGTAACAVGEGGRARRTVDGGAAWNWHAAGTVNLAAVSLADASNGWAAGAGGKIFKTTDGGSTWAEQAAGGNDLQAVAAVSATVGYAAGKGGRLLKTSDGAAWNTVAVPGLSADLNAVFALDATHVWVAGSGGQVRYTSDGGTTWISPTIQPLTQDLRGISFANASTGWIAGDSGAIATTANGGVFWQAQTSGTPHALRAIHARSASLAWIVGDNGTVLKTTNGGSTWTSKPSGTVENLYAVRFASDTEGWAAGAHGLILRTVNGGDSWTIQTWSPANDLKALDFTGPTTGWFVGAGGRILRTTNGVNFVPQGSATASLNAVSFADAAHGFAAGNGGVVLKTTDGTTWSAATSPDAAANLAAVRFATADTGWVAGDGGKIWRTDNGGVSWTAQTSGVTNDLKALAFADGIRGWAAGAGGTILRTTTGGASWASSNDSGAADDLHALAFRGTGTGWAAGAAGRILKFSDVQDKIGFPPYVGTPHDYLPPVIDGFVNPELSESRRPDTGWDRAMRVTCSDGTSSDHVAFQGLRHKPAADYLYLSLEVRNDSSLDNNDYVALLFRGDNPAGVRQDFADNDRRIEIYPNDGTVRENVPPRLMTVSRRTPGNLAQWTAITPTGFDVKVRSWTPGSMSCWSVEAKIPTTVALGGSDWIDIADEFLFAFYVVRLDASGTATSAVEFSWPRERVLSGSTPVSGQPMPASEWGAASKSPSVDWVGVRFADPYWSHVGLQGATPSDPLVHEIQRMATNTFVARVVNDSETAATNVTALFRIANWGVQGGNPTSGSWKEIVGPTAPQTVPAASAASPTTFTKDWNPNDTAGDYAPPRQHQCVLVELDSPDDVNFTQRSVWRNMDFAAASVYERPAVIDVRGMGPPPAGAQGIQSILLRSHESQYDFDPRKDRFDNLPARPPRIKPEDIRPERDKIHEYFSGPAARLRRLAAHHPMLTQEKNPASYRTWEMHAYRKTGKWVNIQGTIYPIVEAVGGFGYVVRHEKVGDPWRSSLRLSGTRAAKPGETALEIPVHGKIDIVTRIEAGPPLPEREEAKDGREGGPGMGFLLLAAAAVALILMMVLRKK